MSFKELSHPETQKAYSLLIPNFYTCGAHHLAIHATDISNVLKIEWYHKFIRVINS